MRDPRFIAEHRGGLLSKEAHMCLARWAADCAEAVLELFEACSNDPRPREALRIARSWAKGEVKTGAAMRASVAAHAAARSVPDRTAIAAARASAHASATAHASDHSMGALLYSMKALQSLGQDPDSEFRLRVKRLPKSLRDQVSSGISARLALLANPGSRIPPRFQEKRRDAR